MRFLAWLLLIVTAFLALGFLLFFIDLVITGIFSGVIYRYINIAEVLALFLATGYMAQRSLRFIWAPRRNVPAEAA
jgi:hypothetical protein